MPVTSGTHANVETIAYNFFSGTMGFNNAVCCGLLANIERESRFNPNLTNSSSGAYGLFQWTSGRKRNLINFCTQLGVDKSSVLGQLKFAVSKTEFNPNAEKLNSRAWTALMKLPNTKAGAYEAGFQFSKLWERHGSATEDKNRGELASGKFWNFYHNKTGALKVGSLIVTIARAQVGKPKASGGIGPNSYDAPGLVYYSYNQAGVTIANMNLETLYKELNASHRYLRGSQTSAGDLLFYKVNSKISSVAIATGTGKRIYVSDSTGLVEEDDKIGNPYRIIRYVSDSQTVQSNVSIDISGTSTSTDSEYTEVSEFTFVGGSANNYVALTTSEDYNSLTTLNLAGVSASGYDYGYLIDMTHGGEFKFYIPEFSESAGSNWGQVEIMGRSVSIMAYQSTNSRKVTISLDLYAGAGLYNDIHSTDIVGKLHSDVNFVKSLEYPDYSNAIARPPSRVHLILGSAFNLAGVVSDVTVEHMKPLDSQNRAMYIKLSFTVTQIDSNPPDYKDIRNGQFAMINSKNVATMNSSGTTLETTNNPGATAPSSTSSSNVKV